MRAAYSFPIAILALSACGGDSYEAAGGNDPIEWAKANPPASESTWAGVEKLVCRPATMDVCGTKGCEPDEPKTFVVWKPDENEYQRCDETGCDSFEAQVNYSGSFANLALPGKSMLFKVASGGSFTEVVSLVDTVLVYRGNCERW